MFLIPLVRPEAFAHGGLVWLASWWRKRRVDWGGGIALAAGVITAVIANLLVSGSVVPQTLAAKQLSPEAFSNIGHNLATLFIENSVFAPVTARSLNPIKPFLAPIVLGLLLWGLVRRRDHRPAWALALALAVVPTAAYAFGGVLFGWYWAPGKIAAVSGAFSAGAMLLSNALHGAGRRRVVRTLVLSGAVIAFCGQVVIGAVNRAIEADGRIEVGNWIREHSPPDATIVLEPAGFIPYYAERRTWDEVGQGPLLVRLCPPPVTRGGPPVGYPGYPGYPESSDLCRPHGRV
jgi:hypothetical protein